MHINDVLFLLTISKQDQELSPCSCSRLYLPGRGHVLVRCSQTVTGLRTLFLFLPFLDLLWNSLVPFTSLTHDMWHVTCYTHGVVNIVSKCQVPSSNGLQFADQSVNGSETRVLVEQPRLHRVCIYMFCFLLNSKICMSKKQIWFAQLVVTIFFYTTFYITF